VIGSSRTQPQASRCSASFLSQIEILIWTSVIFQIFPRGTFTIGKGAAHHRFLSSVRWGVMVALVVSVVGSVVANLLTAH
jgi:hypothetical protein